jgi:acetylornithine deacetylase/succinyl-diaminopimelate desuccinylase-like protein
VSAPPVSSAERPAASAARALDVVRVLAREPRPAGSESEARARGYCAERLRAAGFVVREERFDYSAFPGRWGTPAGGLVALVVLVAAAAAGRADKPGVAVLCLALGGAIVGLAVRWLARTGVLMFPGLRRSGVNLVATRGNPARAESTLWLMAHLDSKSQPVPILLRAAGITLVGAAWIAGVIIGVAQLARGQLNLGESWLLLAVVASAGAIPVIATTVGSRSPGALDNATGVATVLAAAEEARDAPCGVCLTSAEELGLAGARAWVRAWPHGPAVAINCDGVDDVGATTCMYTGRRPDTLVASVLAASARTGSRMRAHRLLPGVLTDGVALADAAWSVVTLSKGGARTLARIHTPRDHADHLTGIGMAEVAHVIANLLETGA